MSLRLVFPTRIKLERHPFGWRSLPQEEKDEHYRPSLTSF